MNFPVWEIPVLGGGLLIGIIAVVHVFISHFAVGGGLFLVLTERKARRENSAVLLDYVKRHSKFFLLLSVVAGAVTGVGIWFAIGLVHPTATSSLIHAFVWGWAIEWVFFLVEVTSILVYVKTWDTMDARTHMAVGWIYAVSSLLTLAVINGIVAFMLTPGDWLQTRGFWDAILNPSYLPSLFSRTFIAVGFAGVYAFLTATLLPPLPARAAIIRYSARWVLPALILLPLALLWYNSVIPETSREIVGGGIAAIETTARYGMYAALALLVLVVFGPLLRPKHFSFGQALVLLVLASVALFAAERVREAVRKPYILYGYMYANGVRVEDYERVEQAGVLASSKWMSAQTIDQANELRLGRELFRAQCMSCHTVGGYQDIVPHLAGRTADDLDVILMDLSSFRGYMPPFAGNDQERLTLARWLMTLPQPDATARSLGGRQQ